MIYHTLITVPGHGICINPNLPIQHDSWEGIYDYPEEAQLLYDHCKIGIGLAAAMDDSILIFTGGMTRDQAGRISEAESYLSISRHKHWWGFDQLSKRTFVETKARDSFENLLFSIGEFRLQLGYFPKKVLVVGFKFKQRRFEFHANSLNWSKEFQYLGVNNPPKRNGVLSSALKGEEKKYNSIIDDRFHLGQDWVEQRNQRNPFNQALPDFSTIPELKKFMDFLYGTKPVYLPNWID